MFYVIIRSFMPRRNIRGLYVPLAEARGFPTEAAAKAAAVTELAAERDRMRNKAALQCKPHLAAAAQKLNAYVLSNELGSEPNVVLVTAWGMLHREFTGWEIDNGAQTPIAPKGKVQFQHKGVPYCYNVTSAKQQTQKAAQVLAKKLAAYYANLGEHAKVTSLAVISTVA
jgi:hypothetical protein